jgi:hypothetical protein
VYHKTPESDEDLGRLSEWSRLRQTATEPAESYHQGIIIRYTCKCKSLNINPTAHHKVPLHQRQTRKTALHHLLAASLFCLARPRPEAGKAAPPHAAVRTALEHWNPSFLRHRDTPPDTPPDTDAELQPPPPLPFFFLFFLFFFFTSSSSSSSSPFPADEERCFLVSSLYSCSHSSHSTLDWPTSDRIYHTSLASIRS